MAKVVACIIARTVSTRLPLKIFRDLTPGDNVIEFLIQRTKAVKEIDEVYLCTSNEPVDEIMEDVALRNGIKCYRGSADEVIERLMAVGEIEQADLMIRITGDNPLISTEYIGEQIKFLQEENLDYVRVADVPVGSTVEVFTYECLKDCDSRMDRAVSEYLLLYLFEPSLYKCGVMKVFEEDYSAYNLAIDHPEDLVRFRNLLAASPRTDKRGMLLTEIMEQFTDESKAHLYPGKKLSQGGMTKLPYNKVVPFEEFQADLNRRKQDSLLKKLYE